MFKIYFTAYFSNIKNILQNGFVFASNKRCCFLAAPKSRLHTSQTEDLSEGIRKVKREEKMK